MNHAHRASRGRRLIAAALASVASVGGCHLGEGACACADSETGPHVAAFNGNLTITMRTTSVAGTPHSDGELLSLMTEVEQRVLTRPAHP